MIQSLSSSFNGQLGGGDTVISQTPLSRDVCAALVCSGRSICFVWAPPLCAVALPPRKQKKDMQQRGHSWTYAMQVEATLPCALGQSGAVRFDISTLSLVQNCVLAGCHVTDQPEEGLACTDGVYGVLLTACREHYQAVPQGDSARCVTLSVVYTYPAHSTHSHPCASPHICQRTIHSPSLACPFLHTCASLMFPCCI